MQPSFLAERVRSMGRENVGEMHEFIQAHVWALKDVVEREGIECESELRRSWDVLLDAEEARTVERELGELRRSGFRGIEMVDCVGSEFAARVSLNFVP